ADVTLHPPQASPPAVPPGSHGPDAAAGTMPSGRRVGISLAADDAPPDRGGLMPIPGTQVAQGPAAPTPPPAAPMPLGAPPTGTTPAIVATAPGAFGARSPGPSEPVVESYDEETYRIKPTDTWETICKE